MVFEKSVLRFAHANGYTHCCYTEDGSKIITSGTDGDIRIWQDIHDDDPTSQCVGEFVLGIAHFNNRIFASTDLNTVQVYTFPDGDRDGTEFRFTGPVTCIAVNNKYIAAGSEDTLIKVALHDKTEEQFELTGHEGPILKMSLCSKDLLATSSGDGSIRVWNLVTKKEVKQIVGFDIARSFYATQNYVSPSFEPSKCATMAYIKRNEIVIVDTNNWNTVNTLKDDNITSGYTVCQYSPCGRFLAAGTESGDILIWDVRLGRAVKVDPKGHDDQAHSITCIDWNPSKNNELVYADNTGQLGTISDSGVADEGINTVENGNEVTFDGIDFAADEEDDNNENCVSLAELKGVSIDNKLENEIDELLETVSNRTDSAKDCIDAPRFAPLQPPFQPSSTPKHLEHRYLLWNSVGIVRMHTTDSENSIEVEFHDASIHHGIHMSNYLNHTMAGLSNTVLALSGETPSKLVCIALRAGSREWSISLPNCEEVLALTTTDKLVAVATDSRFLRLFSVMGTQREVLCMPGPVLALTGHGDSILAVYHSGASNENKTLSGVIVQAIGLSLRCRDIQVPLTPGSKLNWIGYTDAGSPVSCDSLGMIRLFNVKSNYWMPICDTSTHIKNASDTYFVLDVSERSQIIRAILCRGSSFPVVTPKPMVSELPMQLPLCDLESEKAQLEESLIRYANLCTDRSDKLLKEVAIKLFALACRSEMETRARELIEMIASPQLLNLAVKYASKLGRIHLCEKLGELLPQFEQQENEKEKRFSDIQIEAINLLQNSPMGATLLLGPKDTPNSNTITPKPLMISQQRRNPFKRDPNNTTAKFVNPLSHLTGKAIGFDDSQSSVSLDLTESSENDTTDLNVETQMIETNIEDIENKAQNQKNQPLTFMAWFQEHKEELQLEYPDAISAELTKHAMRKFKSLSTDNKNTPTNKRKMIDDGKKQSGILKLAKYSSDKN